MITHRITARLDEAVATPRPSIKSAGRAHKIRHTPFSAGITHADRLHDGLNLPRGRTVKRAATGLTQNGPRRVLLVLLQPFSSPLFVPPSFPLTRPLLMQLPLLLKSSTPSIGGFSNIILNFSGMHVPQSGE